MPLHRKSTRLTHLTYLGTKVHFITVCCDHHSPHLRDPSVATRILSVLFDCAMSRSFLLHAYCAMPDHIHFLVHGTKPNSNLLELVRVFKLRTAYEFKRDAGHKLWETSFHDHILRKGDEIESVACYIWANPVRSGLCTDPKNYSFSGSQTNWTQKSISAGLFIPPWKQKPPV
jgi:putative transposase